MKNTLRTLQNTIKNRCFLTLKKLRVVTTILTLSVTMYSTNSLNAQKFAGVELNQSYQIVINSFIAKGWVQSNKTAQYTTLKGKIANESILLTIYPTITSKKCRKIMALYTSPDTWEEALSLYEDKCNIVSNKYGLPVYVNEKFYEPYYEGDGYEIQALNNDKCEYIKIWGEMVDYPNLTIGVEIGSQGMIMVSYEVKSNIELHERELEKIQSNTY